MNGWPFNSDLLVICRCDLVWCPIQFLGHPAVCGLAGQVFHGVLYTQTLLGTTGLDPLVERQAVLR